MITDVGYLAVIMSFAASLYAVGASLWGARRDDDRFVQSGRMAAALTFPLILAGAIGLWFALVTGDFGVKYVAQVSSLDTPLFFRLTALWGSQNGSILFWNLIMSGFIFFAMLRPWREDRPMLPYVTATMMLVLAFFLFINLFVANPFERFAFPPSDGAGLNPLLRHPGMIIHPPMLYAGFTGFIVPFAFCIASLATRRTDNLWLLLSRRWMLVGWAFLTAGLFLGGRWAHDVLGWGGYWGWDPVENKSLVPWLIGTAFLHSAMIQEKRGMFKNWNVFLMLLTFASVIWGTAVVRSGVLTSVHAFAQSDLGPLFLAFIVVMLVWSAALWISRLDTLKSDNKLDSGFSREGIFLLQNVLFLSTALTVFIGTVFPILTEALGGVKITVGPPFYNQVAVPQMAVLVLLMGIAPLMAWGKANARALGRMSIIPLALTALSLGVLVVVGVRQVIPLMLFALSLYTLYQTLIEYGRGAAARMKTTGESLPLALGRLMLRNQRRYGGYLIHLGVVIFAIGATGKGFYGVDVLRNIAINDTIIVGNYAFTYRGLRAVPCEFNDCRTMQASVLVTDARDGSIVGAVFPRRDTYPVQQHTATIADVTGSWFEEVYVILAAWEDAGATASFQVYINPLINLIWLGGLVMILGFGLAFWKAPEPAWAPSMQRARQASHAGVHAER
ncbi:MAG: heme lyase CcmF/NrfE family subunit [Anaerolineae bacterium]|nr:heme lyase CcmF/NrfE family subunit [Thermoflexales bacterium]MDW8406772.1 heme lyase CcmF/NrfE family subunit [Anaerolineae bacterium]